MGLFPRRAGPHRPVDRYGHKPGARPGGSSEPLYDPGRRMNTEPVGVPIEPPARYRDPTELLGRSVLAARTQHLLRGYGLSARSGLSRSYSAQHRGLEISADAHGTIIAVFLHFHGDDGFASYRGEIPGGAGSTPVRAALWAALGRPDESGEAYREKFLGDFGPWDRWGLPNCTLRAQYDLDGERVHRITLTPPPGTDAA
jgi:hypothetical protein